MSALPRYAIYFVPGADSSLYRFGAAVLGYDAYTGEPRSIDGAPDESDATGSVRHRLWRDAAGRAVIEDYAIAGMGHGTPLDSRDELREVVVRQVVQRDLRDGARDLFRGFEVARVSARERGQPERELLRRDRPPPADGIDLVERLLDGVGRGACVDADVKGERTREPAKVEGGPGTVRQALLLTKIEVDAADELSAEHHVRRDEGVIIGRRARNRYVTDPQL